MQVHKLKCHCEESMWTTKQSLEIASLLLVARNDNVKLWMKIEKS
jgi:hypothetical protein